MKCVITNEDGVLTEKDTWSWVNGSSKKEMLLLSSFGQFVIKRLTNKEMVIRLYESYKQIIDNEESTETFEFSLTYTKK